MEAKLIKQAAYKALLFYQTHRNTLSTQEVMDIADQAVARIFSFYQITGAPLRASIELLCELNVSHNPHHLEIGVKTLFPKLIEKLNDAFLPPYCDLYDRIFSQVISFLRQRPEGKHIDIALNQFGLFSEADILRRKLHLRRRKSRLLRTRPIKKVLFLSRVTIGADVAITSVLINHLLHQFPEAELVLIGSQKLQQLYAGNPQIQVSTIDYGRNKTLLSRLETWFQVIDAITKEINSLQAEEFCVFDPDSRLTQLGLLPILSRKDESQSYFYFESRRLAVPKCHKLGQLTAHWIADTTDSQETAFPFLSLSTTGMEKTKQILSYLRDTKKQSVICLSFGVGGNPIKRISDQFEGELVLALSEKSRLVLDCGASLEEYEQIQKLLTLLKVNGRQISTLNELQNKTATLQIIPDVVTWQGDIGTFASLIAASDLYIGYDSSGQHIAAALNTPTITIFVNSGSGYFPQRWQPYGRGYIQTLYGDYPLTEILKIQEKLLPSS